MYCKNCGTKISDDSRFCFKCGTEIDLSSREETEVRVEKSEVKFKNELGDLRRSMNSAATFKIPIILSVIDSKENGKLFIDNYYIEFNSDLIEDLKNLSNSYDTIKEYLQKFIDLGIVEPQYPHDRVDKTISRKTDETVLNKRQFSFPWIVPLIFIVLAGGLLTWLDSTNDYTASDSHTYENIAVNSKIGEVVSVEHFLYRVNSIRFEKTVGNEILNQTADGIYLIVDLSLVNNDRVEHTLDNSLFKLTDENEREFESTHLIMVGIKTMFLQQCNPGIQKQGLLAFEVPSRGVYYLHLSGGFWTGKTAVVKLTTE